MSASSRSAAQAALSDIPSTWRDGIVGYATIADLNGYRPRARAAILQQFNFIGCQVPPGPQRLIACNPRPGIADVRSINPKWTWVAKTKQKSPLRGSKHYETKLRSPVTASVRLSALSW